MATSSNALSGDRDRDRGRGRDRATRNPVTRLSVFVRQIVAELRKVIWPTRNELVTYTIVSVTFVVFMIALVGLLDFAFTKAVLHMFG